MNGMTFWRSPVGVVQLWDDAEPSVPRLLQWAMSSARANSTALPCIATATRGVRGAAHCYICEGRVWPVRNFVDEVVLSSLLSFS